MSQVPDLSKLTLHTGYNAFKNVNKYTGTISFPTSVPAGTTVTTTTTINLTDTPVFTQFYCFFTELGDALFSAGIGSQWYSPNVPGNAAVAVQMVAPVGTYVGGLIYPVIDGTVVTVTASLFNNAPSTGTFTSLTVPFSFIEYTLAS